MYTTRSQQSRQRQQAKKQRQKRIRYWIMFNTVLVLSIVALGGYYWLHIKPQEVQQASSVQTDNTLDPANRSDQDVPDPAIENNDSSELSDHENDNDNENDPSLSTTEGDVEHLDQTSTDDQEAQPSDLEQNAEETDSQSSDTPSNESTATDKAPEQTTTPDSSTNTSAPSEPSSDSSNKALQPATNTTPSGQTVTLNFGGDVMFSGKVGEKLAKAGYDYPYQYVKGSFTSDDLTVVNLETPVTDSNTTAADKTYAFKSSPQALPHMAQAGIDAVNLANNHILDQGITGLTDTITQLDQSGIAYVGAGKDSARAYQPVYFDRKGIKIALLGFSRVIPETSWNAGKNQAGVATAYDATAAQAAIREAKSKADLVVVVAHWGIERSDTLADHQSDLAHTFVDAGADLVIGGHPHVLQGLEHYKGKWIAYSTGNFIFTRSLVEKTWDTGVFQAKCTVNGDCSMQVIPYTAELGQPVPMTSDKAQALLKRLQTLSSSIAFDTKGNAIAN
ncbi:CapA family protein [Paenibacillus sp. KACC 21273]|uniref:CapA family protein n=1 Tax=Paenibacillus sp. KACC 21273 TaxID=3025665 RepID=UPI0023666B01|nr:CapA family protein [Paenibacillus sp. KACC 21273]WDF49521.1 CapA family protein [Paenibacillus sp. KACC 21273]